MICNQCGSLLIETSKIAKEQKGVMGFVTITTFRCSDDKCQARIDKKVADLLEQKLARMSKMNPKMMPKV